MVSLKKDWKVGTLFHTNTFEDKSEAGQVLPGDVAMVLCQSDLWVQIMTANSCVGWIYSQLLRKIS